MKQTSQTLFNIKVLKILDKEDAFLESKRDLAKRVIEVSIECYEDCALPIELRNERNRMREKLIEKIKKVCDCRKCIEAMNG